MKKYGSIIVVLLLLSISLVFNYSLSNKLKTAILLSETLEVDLQDSGIENDILELEVSFLSENLIGVNKQLESKMEAINLINDKLEANGQILESIDRILLDNTKLKKSLTAMYLELNQLEAENSKKTEGIILTETKKSEWDKDILKVLDLLRDRISFLEDGIGSLSTFSIERIMVKQEIDFLESIYSNIEDLKTDIQEL